MVCVTRLIPGNGREKQDPALAAILDINNLHVSFDTPDGVVHAVRGIDCQILPGECLGIVGESGSGKSQTFLATMGLLASNGHVRGSIKFNGRDLVNLSLEDLNRTRGKHVSMIFQDPLTSLTPHMRIGKQMREVLRTHTDISVRDADARCLEWLEHVHIPEARRRLRQYPHELSGGMRQRVMIAMAMLCSPDLLIADEPTTALDVTIQAEILDLMDELRHEQQTAIALITHDMGVVARMCDRIHVMRNGEFVETGLVDDIFYRPQHAYTRMLLDAVPRIELHSVHAEQSENGLSPPQTDKTPATKAQTEATDFLLVRDMRVHFRIPTGLFSRAAVLHAVDGVSFDLRPGETLGIVGESGSGKSTLARAVLQLIPPTTGTVSWLGSSLTNLAKDRLKKARRDMQIVFQDPLASLNPSMPVGKSIMEPLRVYESQLTAIQMTQRVATMMERVGLDQALINRYPHELSGGQNQRVGIARAIILNPKLVICDEAVSALDVSIQAQILTLLRELQQDFGLSYIFISHDLSVVWEISHRVLVLYLGAVVELADRNQLFGNPQHPYTRQLISALPIPDPQLERKRKRLKLKGELSSPMDPLAKLRFLPSRRNSVQTDFIPALQERFPGHYVAEHDPIEELLEK
jgi:oligopeptide/dipeptide ABC transporter ATP-binding protein